MRTRTLRTSLALIVVTSAVALAAPARVWVVQGIADFQEGKLDGISIGAEGVIAVAPSVATIFEGGNPRIWDMAVDGEVVYVATGEPGTVQRIAPDGSSAEYFAVSEGVVQALAVGPEGELYVGVSQPARIYRLSTPGGDADTPWIEIESHYVWALATAPDGALWIATGEHGALLRAESDGAVETLYRSADPHVRSLVMAEDGSAYVGTSGQGLIARVTAAGEAFVLLDTDYEEITGVALREGAVWGGGFAPGGSGAAAGSSNGSGAAGASPRGGVVRIDPDGRAVDVWRSTSHGVYSLALANGEVVAGTGSEGRLYRFTENGPELLLDLDAEQIVAVAEDRGIVYAGGSNAAAVYRINPATRATGTFMSSVRDAGTRAKWGELRFATTGADAGAVQVNVRTGNTGTPDDTWSPWSDPQGSGTTITVPDARFAQIRVSLTGAAELRRVELAYVARNAAPRVDSVRVHPVGVVYRQNATFEDGLPFAQLPASIEAELREQQGGGAAAQASSASFRGRPLFVGGMRTITWDASDPDGDSLAVVLDFRGEDESRWRPLGPGGDDSSFVLDTHRIPDGRYVIRVRASDAADNVSPDALSSEAASEAFVVDNTAPALSALRAELADDGYVVTGTVRDATSIITQLRYSVDGAMWHTMSPVDGVADSAAEEISVRIVIGPGEHTVVVQAIDSALNRGSGQLLLNR